MNKILKLMLISFVFCNSSITLAEDSAKVNEEINKAKLQTEPVATINGEKILEEKVAESFNKNLQPGFSKSYLDLPSDVKEKVIQNYVNNIILLKEAKKIKLEETGDFQNKLASLKEELLLSSMLENYLKDKVSEQDVKNKYADLVIETKGSFDVKFSFIQVNSQKSASDVLSKLKEKQSFASLAKKFSLDAQTKDQGGSIKEFIPLKAIPAFEPAIMKLKNGGVSEAIQFGDFWYIIKLDDKKPAELPSFDEMKSSIQNSLKSIEMKKIMADLMKQYNVIMPDQTEASKEATKTNN